MLELPGLLVSAVIVDRLGRKKSMTILFLLCGVSLLPLIEHQNVAMTTLLLFLARACVTGTFTIVYVYAPEVCDYFSSYDLQILVVVSAEAKCHLQHGKS